MDQERMQRISAIQGQSLTRISWIWWKRLKILEDDSSELDQEPTQKD